MNRLKFAGAALALLLPLTAEAHRFWLLPTSTVVTKAGTWVSFDAAVSNDIFHIDYRPLQVGQLQIATPDGSTVAPENVSTGKLRTTFDLELASVGTYRLFTASNGLTARWEEDGKPKFWPPRGTTPTREAFDKEVPKKADKLVITQSSRRLETFVTAGKPGTEALQPSKVGLELVPITHPNDLFAGETARFSFLIDGKPAVGVKLEIVPGGMRYRNDQAMINVETDKKGEVAITWPTAGLYWLEASYEDDKAPKPATKRSGQYVATFEVLPQ